MSSNPIAFMSYVRMDDAHENGRLSQFRERLSGEVRMQTGEEFEIFQDRNDIKWGQQWEERINGTLDSVTFLIPVITPAFFKSPACRDEFERFLKREAQLGRADLILPVYYVDCPVLSNETKREQDSIAKVIAARQYADWRDLRHEPFTASEVGRRFAAIAKQIVDALERDGQAVPYATRSAATDQATERGNEKIEACSLSEVSERSSGPSPKTEVPTLIVDAFHRGDYATLTEALKAAKPGTRILVRPGLYREGVVIDKPVEIIGDGDRSDIVVAVAGDDVVFFRSSMGRITNLTLRQMGGDGLCVNIAQGRLDLEECDITSEGSMCVVIHDGADPRLRRNRIHDGNTYGVFIFCDGQGILEENDISGNKHSGVAVVSGYTTLRRNRISKNGWEGIRVNGGGGTFEENDLRGNTHGAWSISADSESKVVRRENIEK